MEAPPFNSCVKVASRCQSCCHDGKVLRLCDGCQCEVGEKHCAFRFAFSTRVLTFEDPQTRLDLPEVLRGGVAIVALPELGMGEDDQEGADECAEHGTNCATPVHDMPAGDMLEIQDAKGPLGVRP